jgi:hypothetical protein
VRGDEKKGSNATMFFWSASGLERLGNAKYWIEMQSAWRRVRNGRRAAMDCPDVSAGVLRPARFGRGTRPEATAANDAALIADCVIRSWVPQNQDDLLSTCDFGDIAAQYTGTIQHCRAFNSAEGANALAVRTALLPKALSDRAD